MKRNILNSNRNSGFTIIEVLIVLAIAGLIMAVVLLAVPGLQRSQANTAARTDASHIAAATSNWSANNNGVSLNSISQMYSIYQDVGTLSKYTDANASATSTSSNFTTIGSTPSASIGSGWYLATSPITTVSQLTTSPPMPWVIVIDQGVTCQNATNNATTYGPNLSLTAGSPTNIAILFTTETSGNPNWNCLQAQ